MRDSKSDSKVKRWVGATLIIGICITALTAWQVDRRNQEAIDAAVATATDRAADTVINRLGLYEHGLRGTRSLVLALEEQGVTRQRFQRYIQAREIHQGFPGARGFGFIRRVKRLEVPGFVRAAREDDWPGFSIRELSPHSGERYVIQYIEPVERNLPAVGLDIASEANRREAALSALHTGEAKLTGPITLVQATGAPSQSFLLLLPVYRSVTTPASPEERLATGLGWTYTPPLMSEVLADLPLDHDQAHLEIRDATHPGKEELFYTGPTPLANPARLNNHLLQREVFGRQWQFSFTAYPTFIRQMHLFAPDWIFWSGILLSLLMATLVGTVRVNRERQQQLIAGQGRMAAIVESSADGIIGKSLDGTILSWNRGAGQIFGYSASEAVGQSISALLVPDELKDEEAAVLAKISGGEQVLNTKTRRRHRDGHLVDVSITVSPLRGPRDTVIGASTTVRDISEQQAAEARIHELNANLEAQVQLRTAEMNQLNLLLSSVLRAATEVSIIATGLDGKIRLFNRGAERLLGYAAEDIVGKFTTELFFLPEELAARSVELSQEAGKPIEGRQVLIWKPETDGAENREWTLQRRDGSRFIANVLISAMRDNDGQLTGFLGIAFDMTRQKNAERELASSLATTQAILDTAPNPIITIDDHGQVLSFNPAGERVFGYSQAEIVGRNIRLLMPDSGRQASADLFAYYRRDGNTPVVDPGREVLARHKDGTVLPIHLAVGTMTVAGTRRFVGLITDLTEQYQQRMELLAARDQLVMAANVAKLGIWTWTLADNSLRWNDRMLELYGYPLALRESGLNYEHWRQRLHPDDEAATVASLTAAIEGRGSFDPIFRILLPDGQIRYLQAGAHVERDERNQAVKVTGINFDITAQRELETRLLHAKEQADLASAAKSSFLANMSHEIRTPMNAVLGLLQLVRQTELNLRQQDYVDKALSSGRALLSLLNDILDYSKIEAGKLELDPQPLELDTLLCELGNVLSGNQGKKDIEILFAIDPKLPSVVVGDKLRLLQVMINLAGNAFKFTQQGQIVIGVEELQRSGGSILLRFSVTDTGIGISPSQLQRIFESFTQAEASTARRFGGTGLGLVISKRLIDLMHGTLQVASEPDKGSRFWFDVPLNVANFTPIKESCPAADVPLHVLIVDDNPVAAELMTATTEALGWRTQTVSSGNDALERVRTAAGHHDRFDVVLMDWRMPDMDGMQVAEQIRHGAGTHSAPLVIMISAYGREVLASGQQHTDAPFADFLTKPVTPRQLANTVMQALTGKSATAAPASTPGQRIQRLRDMRLLVVDDNAINRQVVAELLQGEGASVALAEGGVEGVATVCAAPDAFDVVIMDMQMPDVDGIEATRRIRADARCARLPIMAMTANASLSDRDACLTAGMNEHVGKPIDLEQTVKILLKLANRRAVQATAAATPVATPPTDNQPSLVEPLASILSRLGGKRALFVRLMTVFEPEQSRLIEEFSAKIEHQDAAGCAATLHAIKGSAGTLGATALAQKAAALERKLNSGDTDAVESVLSQQSVLTLKQLLTECVRALNAGLAQDNPDPAPLPATKNPENVPAPTGMPAKTGAPASQNPRAKILIVDDQPVNIRVLYELFRSDYDVCMATSGEQALAVCASQMPDLVLLDVMMPGMDGHAVCRQLKSDPLTSAIPVIFITGQNDEAEEVMALALGAADFITKPINAVAVMARVKTQVALKQQGDQLRATALQDSLTRIGNRRKFDTDLQIYWRQCSRDKIPLSLILIDVDFFKKYNDHYGHILGDACLVSVAQALQHAIQRPFDSLARYGGEEFACLLPNTDLVGATAIAQSMQVQVRNLNIEHIGSTTAPVVTISLGVAMLIPAADIAPGQLIERADQQLYAAKTAGCGQVSSAALR